MNLRNTVVVSALVLAAWVAPSMAQETLGDLVSSGGYDWIIGRWTATGDNDQKMEFTFDWTLDKHAVLSGIRIGDFKYEGLIMLSPAGEEAVDQGVDNRGGTWKGAWAPEGSGLVRKAELLNADGQTHKGEAIFDKVDADTVTITLYLIDGNGNRNSEPFSKLNYKRQPPAKAAPVTAAGASVGGTTDYQKFGDVLVSGGYGWMVGKWAGKENDRTYELEYRPLLDQHAGSVELKTGDLKYFGLVTYVASRQEVAEFGVDTRGRSWKIVWEPDGSNLVSKSEMTGPDGTTVKLLHVYTKIDNDSFNVKLYAVGADGSRGAEPLEQVTFQRQKPAAPAK